MLRLSEIYKPVFSADDVRLVSETFCHSLAPGYADIIGRLSKGLQVRSASDADLDMLKYLRGLNVLSYEDTALSSENPLMYWRLLGYSTEYVQKQIKHNTIRVLGGDNPDIDAFSEQLAALGWTICDDSRVRVILLNSQAQIDEALSFYGLRMATIPIVLDRFRASIGPLYYPGLLEWPNLSKQAEASPVYLKEGAGLIPAYKSIQLRLVALYVARILMCLEDIASCFLELDLTTMRVKERHV
jgi:hypothetical protein